MIPVRFGQGNVDWQQRINWDELRRKRVKKAQKYMAKYGIGSAIVYNHDRKRYLTSLWNHPYSKHVPFKFALLIKDAGFPYVTAMSIDEFRVKEDAPWLEGRILSEEELLQPPPFKYSNPSTAKKNWSTVATQIKKLLKKHGVADMPISVDYCGPYLIHALEEKGLTVVDGNSWIDECGMVKFDEEIILMKMAAAIQEAGYGALLRDFRVGMRENDAQGIMAKAIYQAGGEYLEGWVVNSGDRTNPRSFNWSDRAVRPREFLTVEACHINYCGYKVCYDRTFLVGAKPSKLQKEVYQTVVEMQDRFRALLKPGVTTHDLARKRPIPGENFKTIEQIKKWRASWSNHFGGTGIAWFSAPDYISLDEPEVALEKNMTVTYHAVFWAEGDAGGATAENTYRITETGCEALTKWPYEEIMILGL
jgi:Xaa-Pro aminopeptidase